MWGDWASHMNLQRGRGMFFEYLVFEYLEGPKSFRQTFSDSQPFSSRGTHKLPHFSDYETHRTIRSTQVLEKENRKKNFEAKNVVLLLPPVTRLHCCPRPLASQVSYIWTTRHTRFSSQIWGVVHLIVQKIRYLYIRGSGQGVHTLRPLLCWPLSLFNLAI